RGRALLHRRQGAAAEVTELSLGVLALAVIGAAKLRDDRRGIGLRGTRRAHDEEHGTGTDDTTNLNDHQHSSEALGEPAGRASSVSWGWQHRAKNVESLALP